MNEETVLNVNKAYQVAFSFGGISPNPPLSTLIEFEKLIDVNDPVKTGKQVWLWKRENNQAWKDDMILCKSYGEFGKSIIEVYQHKTSQLQQHGQHQLCPKCFGEGFIPNTGFGGWTTSSNMHRTCPVCNGAKTLIVPSYSPACDHARDNEKRL